MSKLPLRYAVVVLSAILSLSAPVAAQPNPKSCSAHYKDVPIRTVVAGAGIWENWRSSPGSINFESNSIFETAKDQSISLKAPENLCPAGCSAAHRPVLLFSSAPRKTRTDYDDAAMCTKLLAESTRAPHSYSNSTIHNIEELNDWIGDLSQGKGDDGEDLYERCPGDCSPRFEYSISKNGGLSDTYTVRASIICGQARDKDDNKYDLVSAFRWYCE